MVKGGFFLVYRGVFDDFKRKPYSELEAWLWLIASAGYDDNEDLGRIYTTFSELAKDWNWTCGKEKRGHVVRVKRFLQKLQENERVTLCYNNRVNLLQSCYKVVTRDVTITILNYAAYQRRKIDSVTSPLQVCYKPELVCYNGPTFPESSQDITAPKQKNKQCEKINKEEEQIHIAQTLVEPDSNHKTQKQIREEKQLEKQADRQKQLLEIQTNFPKYQADFPEINLDLLLRKMKRWLEGPRGKTRKRMEDVWQTFLGNAQSTIDIAKITYNNRQKPRESDSLEAFTEEVRRESKRYQDERNRAKKC